MLFFTLRKIKEFISLSIHQWHTSKSRCHGSGLIRFNGRWNGETRFEEELLRNNRRWEDNELNSKKNKNISHSIWSTNLLIDVDRPNGVVKYGCPFSVNLNEQSSLDLLYTL